jgi:hypothetical protein
MKVGKLIRYGLTAGLAFAVHVPLQTNLQEYVGVSPMPYLAFLPGWWRSMGNITRPYCADMFLFDTLDHAQKAANSMAEEIALRRFQAENPGKPFPATSDPTFKSVVRKYSGWNEDKAGACTFWQTVGFYGGYPTTFNVDGRAIPSDTVKARDYKPYGSAGVIWVPTAALAVTAGMTWSHALDDNKDAATNHTVRSLTFGLGGNLDLAGLLLK